MMSTDSIRIMSLMGSEEYAEVIQILGAVPEQERAEWENWILAQALCEKTDTLTPDRRAELEEARRLLELCRPTEQDDERKDVWQQMMGKVLYQLEEYQSALRLLRERAPLADSIREISKRPQPAGTFAAGTKKAWKAFEEAEEKLRREIQYEHGDKKAEKRLMRSLDSVLNKAFGDVGYSWDAEDGPWIRLDPIRSKSVALQESYFARHMPESVKKHWIMQVGIPGSSPEETESMRKAYPGDIQTQIQPQDNGKYHLELYHERFHQEDKSSTENIDDELSWVLGDGIKVLLIESVGINYEPLEGKYILLTDVPYVLQLLTNQPLADDEVMWRTRLPLETMDVQLDSLNYAVTRWRWDITRGTSMDPNLQNEFLFSVPYTSHHLAQGGAFPGFVVFPRTKACSSEKLMQELEKDLDEEDGLVLGEAESPRFFYLDLLAWDLKAAQEAAVSLLQRHGVPWACWHSFYFLDRTVQLF